MEIFDIRKQWALSFELSNVAVDQDTVEIEGSKMFYEGGLIELHWANQALEKGESHTAN